MTTATVTVKKVNGPATKREAILYKRGPDGDVYKKLEFSLPEHEFNVARDALEIMIMKVDRFAWSLLPEIKFFDPKGMIRSFESIKMRVENDVAAGVCAHDCAALMKLMASKDAATGYYEMARRGEREGSGQLSFSLINRDGKWMMSFSGYVYLKSPWKIKEILIGRGLLCRVVSKKVPVTITA